jgi:hypothetical protein
MYNYKNRKIFQLEATTVEDSIDVAFIKVSNIYNKGNEDLLVSYDVPFAEAGNEYEIIPAGINLAFGANEAVNCNTLYFKTLSGSTNFQFAGFKDGFSV